MASTPSIKAMLICDQIIHEQGTNKKSLIGIFQDIHLQKFPARFPRIGVYINLTDAHGTYVLDLKLLSTKDGKEIGRGTTPPVEIDSPLRTCEFALQIQNLMFPEPGVYEFQLHVNEDLLGTKSFRVKQIEMAAPPPSGPGTT